VAYSIAMPERPNEGLTGSSLACRLAVAARPLMHRLPRGGDRLLGWLRIDRLTDPPERVGSIAGGALIRADLRDRIQRRMYWLGVYERPETRWLRSHLSTGDVFFDVGAHVGYYTLVAASCVGRTGTVYSFEPFPENFARLQLNLALNSYTHVVAKDLAVSNRSGTSLFAPPTRRDERGWGSLTSNTEGEGVRISTIRLDDFVAAEGIKHITAIKVDIEGAEGLAIDGMTKTLVDLRPRYMLIELNREALLSHGSSPESVISQVAPYGYRPHRLERNRAVRLTEADIGRLSFLNLAIFLRDDADA